MLNNKTGIPDSYPFNNEIARCRAELLCHGITHRHRARQTVGKPIVPMSAYDEATLNGYILVRRYCGLNRSKPYPYRLAKRRLVSLIRLLQEQTDILPHTGVTIHAALEMAQAVYLIDSAAQVQEKRFARVREYEVRLREKIDAVEQLELAKQSKGAQ